MTSSLTHAIAGYSVALLFERHSALKPCESIGGVALMGGIVALLPDADVLPLNLRLIPYEHFFGHRGFFHSPCFYLLFAPLLALIMAKWAKLERRLGVALGLLSLCFLLCLMSHSVLDALCHGGRGVMLYDPFDSGRHFFSWQPVPAAPLQLKVFLSARGWQVMKAEALFFMPMLAWIALLRWTRPRGSEALVSEEAS